MRLVFILLLILPACNDLKVTDSVRQRNTADSRQVILNAFNSTECTNPCWLGIEVGVTTREEVIVILEEHNIDFTPEGYGGGVLHLHSMPDGLVPGIEPRDSASGKVYGDIGAGEDDTDTVRSIDFFLDLCVSTVVDTYGAPGVWFTQDGLPSILVYPDHDIFFSVDTEKQRIDSVILHTKDVIPSTDELESWSEYANAFEECSDVFSEDQG